MSLDVVAALLIILAVADWCWTLVILWYAHQEGEPALTERASTAVILSVIATGAAALGAARLGFLNVSNVDATVILSGGLLLVSAPQFVWGAGLLLGKFR